jgi:hypothetical protein
MSNILRILNRAVAAARAGQLADGELFSSCVDMSERIRELVAERPQLQWCVAEVRAPSYPYVPPVQVVFRSVEETLKMLVKDLPIRWGFWEFETTQGGERIYDHPCGAKLFEAVCNAYADTGLWPLLVQGWSDKANLTMRGNKSYQLSLVVLGVRFDEYREQWPSSAIAFLPIIDRSHLPLTFTERDVKLYKAEIEAACMERVLFPALDADHGFRCVDNTGATRDVLPVLHSWLADFAEQGTLAGLIGMTGCALCDVAGAALLPSPGADANAAAAPSTPRTAAAMESALARALACGRPWLQTDLPSSTASESNVVTKASSRSCLRCSSAASLAAS